MLSINDLGNEKYEVALPVNLDFEMHKPFRETLREVMSYQPKEVVFDFNEVDYIDSAGLGMLMLARQETNVNECKLVLKNLSDGHPRKVLEMVKFDQLFNIEYA